MGRPLSFSAGSPMDTSSVPAPNERRMSMNAPPGPQHSNSTPTITTTYDLSDPVKRPPQPSNLARLGPADPPKSSSPIPAIPRSTSMSSASGLGPHGSSGLNPNAPAIKGHVRSPSFNIAKSPSMSRSGSNTGSAAPRSAGMPYKIGFQPAGVKNDRTGAFAEARRKAGVEREKEEGRLGRRWAKVSSLSIPANV